MEEIIGTKLTEGMIEIDLEWIKYICNETNRKNNQLRVVYFTRTNKKEKRSRTEIQLYCDL